MFPRLNLGFLFHSKGIVSYGTSFGKNWTTAFERILYCLCLSQNFAHCPVAQSALKWSLIEWIRLMVVGLKTEPLGWGGVEHCWGVKRERKLHTIRIYYIFWPLSLKPFLLAAFSPIVPRSIPTGCFFVCLFCCCC